MQVICAKKGAYLAEVEAGKSYYWCTCGLSKNQVSILILSSTAMTPLVSQDHKNWSTC